MSGYIGWRGFSSWYLLPTIRFGLHDTGGWCYFMWLKFDAGVHWGR